MEMLTVANKPWYSRVLPDSPDELNELNMNSEDLQPTLALHSLMEPFTSPLVVVGDYERSVTLGRGGASTIKIGRRNRQISRIHVSIEFSAQSQRFELTVVGLNGAHIDDVGYNQNDVVMLEDSSSINVLGDLVEFRIPPRPIEPYLLKENLKDIVDGIKPLDNKASSEEDAVMKDLKEPHTIISDDKKMKEDLEGSKTLVSEESSIPQEEDCSKVIIEALVFSRTSSIPASDIFSRIIKSNPAYGDQSRDLWMERIHKLLKEKPFFGEIQRKGKTADGSPKENLYYYNSELDPVKWRRDTYQVGRSARKCTLKDKQYFWKIPPKLGRHRGPETKRSRENDQDKCDAKKTKL